MPDSWSLLPPVDAPPGLLPLVEGQTLVAQILAQRGIDTPEKALSFLDPRRYTPAPPASLYGLIHAGELLAEALAARRRIFVWGDFDVDGQTSTALLVSALQDVAGADRVRFHVPNRFEEGHGIQLDKLKQILADPDFRPDILLTCDTGIAEDASVGYAKDAGLTVIITDHHDPAPALVELARQSASIWGASLPSVPEASVRRADAIVNPKFQAADDPLRTLPGVGVAYKLIQHVYALLGCSGQEEELLDLVALGIVADVAEQVHDARYLLQLGLQRLRRTRRIGLLALMDIADLKPETVDAESIGFQLGPRMNALGRLEDATVAVELLTTRDPVRAGQLAAQMERLNQQRRLLTSQITGAALDMLERRPQLLDYNALVLAHPSWHAGIVGIVASRLVEQFHKPAVLLLTPEGAPARGSARSIPGVDIGASIAACSDLLIAYGGHPGAAGVTLPRENVDRFREALHRQVARHTAADVPPGLVIDAELPLHLITMPLVEQLQRLAPFGSGNPAPVFITSGVEVTEDKRIGKDASHRRLTVAQGDAKLPVIWFGGGDADLAASPIDLVHTVGINEYNGNRIVQLTYVNSRAASGPADQPPVRRAKFAAVHDLRNEDVLPGNLPAPDAAAWYAEGVGVEQAGAPYAPRTALSGVPRHRPFVLWSIPPSPDLLLWLTETAQPSELYLCGNVPVDDTSPKTLRNVASMCKYALSHDKKLNIERMAARLGTTEAVVRRSLLWLESRGLIVLAEWQQGDSLRVEPGQRSSAGDDGSPPNTASSILQAELEQELAEVRAYRRYYLRAGLHQLGLGIDPPAA